MLIPFCFTKHFYFPLDTHKHYAIFVLLKSFEFQMYLLFGLKASFSLMVRTKQKQIDEKINRIVAEIVSVTCNSLSSLPFSTLLLYFQFFYSAAAFLLFQAHRMWNRMIFIANGIGNSNHLDSIFISGLWKLNSEICFKFQFSK